jgi:hypothetical protein
LFDHAIVRVKQISYLQQRVSFDASVPGLSPLLDRRQRRQSTNHHQNTDHQINHGTLSLTREQRNFCADLKILGFSAFADENRLRIRQFCCEKGGRFGGLISQPHFSFQVEIRFNGLQGELIGR